MSTAMLTAMGGFYGLLLMALMLTGAFFAGLAVANMARHKYTRYTRPGAYTLPKVKGNGVKGAGKGSIANTVFLRGK